MLVDISQWRKAIGCFLIKLLRTAKFLSALKLFSLVWQIASLCMFSYILTFALVFVLPISLFINFFTIHSVHRQCHESHLFPLDCLSSTIVYSTMQHIVKYPTVFCNLSPPCFNHAAFCWPISSVYCG